MIEEIRLWHQIFAGEGAGSGATGASGGDGAGEGTSTGTTVEDAGDDGRQALRNLGVPESVLDRSRSKGRLPSRLQSAFREGAGAAAPAGDGEAAGNRARGSDGDTPTGSAAPATGSETDGGQTGMPSWDEIKKNPQFNAQIQSIVQSRLKEEGSASETLKALAPVLQTIAQEKGVQIDVSDMGKFDAAAFAKAMQRDNSFFESKAAELGVTPEIAKEIIGLQDFRDEAMAQQHEAEQREEFNAHMAKLEQQAEELRATIPDFDLRKELKNDDFMRMTSPMAGLTVQQAYFALHHDEMMTAGMAAATRRAQEQLANSVRANQRRPQESGAGGGGQPGTAPVMHPSKMTKEERAELKKQIRYAAAKGKKVYPQ